MKRITKKQFREQLTKELKRADEGFLRTELGKLLKVELSRLGYWKNKPRGKPQQNF